MSFPDEDLQRLRDGEMSVTTMETKIAAFIARLEAAEATIRHDSKYCLMECDCDYFERVDAWRKAAGK